MLPPDRLALALDFPDLSKAKKLARQLSDYFGILKIGLTLWAAHGPGAVKTLKSKDHRIFLDLKLHDIPHQVYGAAKAVSMLGVDYLTLHSAGGMEMLKQGARGLNEHSKNKTARALAVTVLTSHANFDRKVFEDSVNTAVQAECGGIVCSAEEVGIAKSLSKDIFCVVPGIRQSGQDKQDQARPATLESAVSAGADVLVIGRAITLAHNPLKAAQEMFSA